MKMIVKLAVLFATLLLLTGVAFAPPQDCHCYEVTCTNLDSDLTVTHEVTFCYDYGYFAGLCNESGNMSLFFDSMSKQAISTSSDGPYASLSFHGDNQYVVNGIVYCYDSRWTIRGHIIRDDWCVR